MEYVLLLLSIIMINILLSGDNALVIALASRNLPIEQQKKAMLWGSVGAIVLRVALTFIAVFILNIPYLQALGGFMLIWIAIKLVADQKGPTFLEAKKNLWDTIKTIIAADFIMSLDNVIAIAGVAKGKISLLIVGLVISIPIIIWGSKFVGMLIQKWPILILIGAFFLGWTAGGMIFTDKRIILVVSQYLWMDKIFSGICGLLVVFIGKRKRSKKDKSRK